jgi:hypothetical protein
MTETDLQIVRCERNYNVPPDRPMTEASILPTPLLMREKCICMGQMYTETAKLRNLQLYNSARACPGNAYTNTHEITAIFACERTSSQGLGATDKAL